MFLNFLNFLRELIPFELVFDGFVLLFLVEDFVVGNPQIFFLLYPFHNLIVNYSQRYVTLNIRTRLLVPDSFMDFKRNFGYFTTENIINVGDIVLVADMNKPRHH